MSKIISISIFIKFNFWHSEILFILNCEKCALDLFCAENSVLEKETFPYSYFGGDDEESGSWCPRLVIFLYRFFKITAGAILTTMEIH